MGAQMTRARSRLEAGRLTAAAGWGVVATLAMSVLMLLSVVSGLAPMPEPIPLALVKETVGVLPQPALMAVAAAAHLAYGALAAVVLAALAKRVSLPVGLGYGVVLWAVMGLVWLPYLGWGLFGTGITPIVVAATLVLHLVYGGTLGLLLDRSRS